MLRLARLGVDTRAQGLGIGNALLRHVLALAVEQRDRIGCVGVVTDAKPEAVSSSPAQADRAGVIRPEEPLVRLRRRSSSRAGSMVSGH